MADENNPIDPALNPPSAKSRLGARLLSPRESLQRTAACATMSSPFPACKGTVHVGMFFDGTGNNEELDYKKSQSRGPRYQSHSNVVRLYHAHPDELKIANDGYYRYYIPGLGTPFKEVGDSGEGLDGTLGASFGRYGAARVAWGLTRVFNAVSRHLYGGFLINDKEAANLADEASSLLPTSAAIPRAVVPPAALPALVGAETLAMHMGTQRAPEAFGQQLQKRLKSKFAGYAPVGHIVVNVFGFSRGAAEARVFVNWLFGVCEQKDGAWLFAGIPLQVQFLGIFDTVASVGMAGLYRIAEGRLGWAENNLQVHPAVKRCVHMVAAHEVRACFPLDSVRVGGRYPPNVAEFLYPGSHSDVGGGYLPLSLGKADWLDEARAPDRQLARVPGFEMYCQALAAGVPFLRFEATGSFKALGALTIAALKPSPITAEAFDRYFEAAVLAPGPLEDMVGQHMSLYFTHRWRIDNFDARPEMQRARGEHTKGDGQRGEPDWMEDTQVALVFVIAGLCAEIERRIAERGVGNEPLRQPFVAGGQATGLAAMLGRLLPNFVGPLGALVELFEFMGDNARDFAQRRRVLHSRDPALTAKMRALARRAPYHLQRWREFLTDGPQADIRTTAVERDGVRLLEALRTQPLPPAVTTLFDALVHDSVAGFIGKGMPEFQLNGHGIAKFRRIFFGDQGDEILREAARRRNEAAIKAAEMRQADRARWDLEAREHGRMRR